MQAPWTEIGGLQSEIRDIKSELGQMVRSYELHSLTSRVDRLEHSVRETSSQVNELLSRIETVENRTRGLDVY